MFCFVPTISDTKTSCRSWLVMTAPSDCECEEHTARQHVFCRCEYCGSIMSNQRSVVILAAQPFSRCCFLSSGSVPRNQTVASNSLAIAHLHTRSRNKHNNALKWRIQNLVFSLYACTESWILSCRGRNSWQIVRLSAMLSNRNCRQN